MDIERRLYLRLFSFCIGSAMDIISFFIDTCILNNTDFDLFLKQHKHKMFHLWIPTIPCCECITSVSIAAPNKRSILNISQMKTLYKLDGAEIKGHVKTNHKKETSQHCLCKISALPGITTENLDIGLVHSLIKTCSSSIFSKVENHLGVIRNIRNELAHHDKRGIMTEIEFNQKWNEMEIAVLAIAKEVSIPYERKEKKLLSSLKKMDVNLTDVTDRIEYMEESMKQEFKMIMDEQNRIKESLETKADKIKQEILSALEKQKDDFMDLSIEIKKLTFAVNLQGIEYEVNSERPETSVNKRKVERDHSLECKQEPSKIQSSQGRDETYSDKCQVEWRLKTPDTWNVEMIKVKLEDLSRMLRQWFYIEFVYVGSLVIHTSVPRHVLRDRQFLTSAIQSFLEKIVEVCEINTDVPETINVDFRVLDTTFHSETVKSEVERLTQLPMYSEKKYSTNEDNVSCKYCHKQFPCDQCSVRRKQIGILLTDNRRKTQTITDMEMESLKAEPESEDSNDHDFSQLEKTTEPLELGDTESPDDIVMATEEEQSNSLWLYNTLETIGVSEKPRRKFQKNGIQQEILHNIRCKGIYSVYRFGSVCEGTTTPGMETDLDLVVCPKRFPVIEHVHTGFKTGWASVMVTDPETAVGYVKLQVVKDGLPLTSKDWERVPSKQYYQADIHGRLVWKHSEITSPKDDFDCVRNVSAYRCVSWPSLADEWIGRVRHHGWPGTTVIECFKKMGCFLVGVGHPNSTEKDLEWRMSFSLQERELMFGLNDVQYKCYVLLKLIKRDLIKAAIGDSLSSYHCKTCLFYTIERNPLDIWRPANLDRCVIQCLQLLLEWTNNNNCPNYFIPGENMYDHRIQGCVRDNLSRVLNELLSEGSGLFNRMKIDNVGNFLLNRGSSSILKTLEEESKTRLEVLMFHVQMATIQETLLTVMQLLHDTLTGGRGQRNITRYSPDDIHVAITRLRELINWLTSITLATEHTTEDTQDTKDLLLPFFHTYLASHLASLAMVCNDTKLRGVFIEESLQYYQHGMSSDLTSGRLKYLTFLFFDGRYNECEKKLISLEKEFKSYVISISKVSHLSKDRVKGARILANSDLRTRDVFKILISSNVIFLPTETNLIPQALQFEMFRSFGTPENSRNEYTDYWYDWVVVDGKVYLYFLWYILAVKMNKPMSERTAIFYKLTLSAVDCVFNTETAYNLVAWVAKKEGSIRQAFTFLIASWKQLQQLYMFNHKGLQKTRQAYHNAAKWHMLLLLMNIWQPKPHLTQGDEANVRFCFECFQQALDRFEICNKCKVAQYCSETCQIKNKEIHDKICQLFQSAVEKV